MTSRGRRVALRNPLPHRSTCPLQVCSADTHVGVLLGGICFSLSSRAQLDHGRRNRLPHLGNPETCGDKEWRNNLRERSPMLYHLSYRTPRGTARNRTGNRQIICSSSCIRRRPDRTGDKGWRELLNPVAGIQSGVRTRSRRGALPMYSRRHSPAKQMLGGAGRLELPLPV
jgi:hypothetical protein